MKQFWRLGLVIATLSLTAACGDNNARYLLEPPATDTRVAVRVSTIEVRDVTLPSYAAASEVVQQDSDGALRPLARAVWADDPVRSVTLALTRMLDARSTATAMSEPWPLERYPDARVEVRIDRMVPGADGKFRLSGQYSIASPDSVIRESINGFDISVPLTGDTPGAVAQATGAAVGQLADAILARLRR